MGKFIKIFKLIVGCIIVFILMMCCNLFEWIPFAWLRDFLTSIATIMNNKSEIIFTILLILCFVYIVFDLFKISCNKLANADNLEQLEVNQSDCIKDINMKFTSVDISIINIRSKIKDYQYQISINVSEYDKRVQQSYCNIKSKYEKNLLSYHLNTKLLYRIALQADTEQQITDVIEKYILQLNPTDFK